MTDHSHDFTLTGPNGSVRFSILALGIYLAPTSGEPDCMATRYAEQLRDEWRASGEDPACIWARLGEAYATLPGFVVAEPTRWGLFAGSDLIAEFAEEGLALRELDACREEAIAENEE